MYQWCLSVSAQAEWAEGGQASCVHAVASMFGQVHVHVLLQQSERMRVCLLFTISGLTFWCDNNILPSMNCCVAELIMSFS